jgi:hypothetical protein
MREPQGKFVSSANLKACLSLLKIRPEWIAVIYTEVFGILIKREWEYCGQGD